MIIFSWIMLVIAAITLVMKLISDGILGALFGLIPIAYICLYIFKGYSSGILAILWGALDIFSCFTALKTKEEGYIGTIIGSLVDIVYIFMT